MPFKKGVAPVRRTLEYLHAGRLKFRPGVAVLTTNYNVDQKASNGAYEFMFWHYPQIRYHNPNLQLLKFRNMTPTPCIQILLNEGQNFVIDVYDRTREEIHNHIFNTFCDENYQGIKTVKKTFNPANFGHHCRHWCMCEYPGQVPCPSFTPLPKHMRGKYQNQPQEEES